MASAAARSLKFAVLGTGRMGARHAQNVAYRAPRAELASICDPRSDVLDSLRGKLPPAVKQFKSAEECMDQKGLEAVLIATETSTHADLAKKAMERGLHVLLEKPISIDLEQSREVVQMAQKHPELKVMVGFSRRFDESYQAAHKWITSGQAGRTHLIHSATNDLYDSTGFFVQYSQASGGIYMDCGIHDIDIGRWLLDAADTPNPTKQVARVFAMGQNTRHPELAERGDADNAIGTVEFTNGKILTFHLSRTSMHGHDCFAEVFAENGKMVINGNPMLNRAEIRDVHGVRTESTPTYYERFREAFVNEVNAFTDSVLDDTPLPVNVQDALEASKIATALTHSFRTGQPVYFDEQGEAILA